MKDGKFWLELYFLGFNCKLHLNWCGWWNYGKIKFIYKIFHMLLPWNRFRTLWKLPFNYKTISYSFSFYRKCRKQREFLVKQITFVTLCDNHKIGVHYQDDKQLNNKMSLGTFVLFCALHWLKFHVPMADVVWI